VTGNEEEGWAYNALPLAILLEVGGIRLLDSGLLLWVDHHLGGGELVQLGLVSGIL
jgi:hypothetical protein